MKQLSQVYHESKWQTKLKNWSLQIFPGAMSLDDDHSDYVDDEVERTEL